MLGPTAQARGLPSARPLEPGANADLDCIEVPSPPLPTFTMVGRQASMSPDVDLDRDSPVLLQMIRNADWTAVDSGYGEPDSTCEDPSSYMSSVSVGSTATPSSTEDHHHHHHHGHSHHHHQQHSQQQQQQQQKQQQQPEDTASPSKSRGGDSDNAVSIELASTRRIGSARQDLVPVLVRLAAPDKSSSRTPADYCCVLDVSGSMYGPAKIQGLTGATESHGLSLLDVAKHGVRTLIRMLGAQDRLSIVAFNQEARGVLPMTEMNAHGKQLAEDKLYSLSASGGANLWRGLRTGLECFRAHPLSGRFLHTTLFTDGDTPDKGRLISELARYIQRSPELSLGTIHTFGFGNEIDARLLAGIARVGNGTYTYISDAGMMGTAFINAWSNMMVTFASEVKLNLICRDGCAIHEVLGTHGVRPISGGFRVKVGTLQHGQQKDVVLLMSTSAARFLRVSAEYLTTSGRQRVQVIYPRVSEGHPEVVLPHLFRARLVDIIAELMDATRRTDDDYEQFPLRSSSRPSLLDPEAPLDDALESNNDGTQSDDQVVFGNIGNLKRAAGSKRSLAGTASKDSSNGAPDMPVPSVSSMATAESAFSHASLAKPFQMFQRIVFQHSRDPSKSSTKSPEVQSGMDVQEPLPRFRQMMAELAEDIMASPLAHDNYVKSLVEDIDGQAMQALRDEFFGSWGERYLPSLMTAHQHQICNNFKDSGAVCYGGDDFRLLRDEASEIFNQTPVRRKGVVGVGHRQQPATMAVFNDRHAGCIHGDCLVMLQSGEQRPLKNLKKGDLVRASNDTSAPAAEVLCLARTATYKGPLVRLPSGLLITPHHPIWSEEEGEWAFPTNFVGASPGHVAKRGVEVYSFVVKNANSLLIEGVPCLATGHGERTGAASHPYFGSSKAIDDMKQLAGFSAGFVEHPGFVRDRRTGLVNGLAPAN